MAFADAQTVATVYYGESPATIELAGTVVKGDILGFSSGWKRALATVAGVIQARCVASESGVTGQYIVAYFGKTLLGGSRFTGATADGSVYVAESTDSGKYTQTAPTTTGDANKKIGLALDATTLVIFPNRDGDSVA